MPIPFALFVAAPTVTISTLLRETWDFDHLTRPPVPAYTAAQASSYDRKSDPGPNQDWFANGDAGQFLRSEPYPDRTEYVMADLHGPGVLTRLWSANPTGTLRFYFDGESVPRLQARTSDLLDGRDPRFPYPFAYEAARGHNLYFPLPYAKSLKITVDDQDGANHPSGFYYQVGYRTYAPSTRVETFSSVALNLAKRAQLIAAEHLRGRSPESAMNRRLRALAMPGRTTTLLKSEGKGTLAEFRVAIPFPLKQTVAKLAWNDPAQPHNVLRNLILSVQCGGIRTIEAPLGDFFATAPTLSDFRTLPFEVKGNQMVCRLPMPYEGGIRVTIKNLGTETVPLSVAARFDSQTAPYRLFAQWKSDEGPSQPKVDLNFLNVSGQGYWLGSNLHIENHDRAWWGEGDEKIYVDGESFPSTFGTGTEDYYGYAWCHPGLFQEPYHAQTRCDGPGNFGHTSVKRFHILDPIPYTRSLKFDMERWHWANCEAKFSRISYWYARPRDTAPVPVDTRHLAVHELLPPTPVPGAIEGETLIVKLRTGGDLSNQLDFWETSGQSQLWWTRPAVGDRLVLEVPVALRGRYEVVGHFCQAVDYGIHQLRLGGKDLGTLDFYQPNLGWKLRSLGEVDLEAGKAELEVTCRGANASAAAGRMFGLDYLLLKRK